MLGTGWFGAVGVVGVVGWPAARHGVDLSGTEPFYSHVRVLGGLAFVRRFLPELIERIWRVKINPSKAFDLHLRRPGEQGTADRLENGAYSRSGRTMYQVPAGVVHTSTPGQTWWRFQPGLCFSRWCRRHRGARLQRHVRPGRQGTVWSRSQRWDARLQVGKTQVECRFSISRRRLAGGR